MLPSLTAFTFPLLSTVTIDASLDSYLSSLLVASDGLKLATILCVSPTFNDTLLSLTLIELTLTTLPVTWTVVVADTPPIVALICASPGEIPFTKPLSFTVATFELLVVNSIKLISAPIGEKV